MEATTKSRTGLVFDERMALHQDPTGHHVECPERITQIYSKLQEEGLVQSCQEVPCREVTEAELCLVHSGEMVAEIQGLANLSPDELREQSFQYRTRSLFFNSDSPLSARLSCGSLLELTDLVVSGELENGIAVIRPPGHHAEPSHSMGFCVFNNVAVAARHAIAQHSLSRVLIVDWDVHHGNGTQHAFQDDPRVLYFSVHRYHGGFFYPGSRDAAPTVVGTGAGTGYTANVGWEQKGMGDGDYLAAWQRLLLPMAMEFDPQLVLVSAGFDAARGDPLGQCDVTPAGYWQMTHALRALACGRVVVALEGGYSLTAISASMAACARSLLGMPCPPQSPLLVAAEGGAGDGAAAEEAGGDEGGKEGEKATHSGCYPSPAALRDIQKTIAAHAPYWHCFAGMGGDGGKTEEEVKGGEAEAQPWACPACTLTNPADAERCSVCTTPNPAGAGGGTTDAVEATAAAAGGAFSVHPRKSCPHVQNAEDSMVSEVPDPFPALDQPCQHPECDDCSENWVCLRCFAVQCGRHVNGHMKAHCSAQGHQVAMGARDLSIWCYGCDSYLDNFCIRELHPAYAAVHLQRFGTVPEVLAVQMEAQKHSGGGDDNGHGEGGASGGAEMIEFTLLVEAPAAE